MKVEEQMVFRDTVSVHHKGNELMLANPPIAWIRLHAPQSGQIAIVEALRHGGGTEDVLRELMLSADSASQASNFYYFMARLEKNGFLCRTISSMKRRLATLVPLSSKLAFRDIVIDPTVTHALSRFAYCHKEKTKITVETPLGHGKVILHDWRGSAILAMLAEGRSVEEICGNIPELSLDECEAFLRMLVNIDAARPKDSDGDMEEESNPKLVQWDFHDLLFHARSRIGRHDCVNKVFPFLNQIDPLPAVKPPMSSVGVPLPVPDMKAKTFKDPPFSEVLEQRRSIRAFDEANPVTIEELGEFLYRSARVREVIAKAPEAGIHYEGSRRPYPCGGAAYELEIYPLVNRCRKMDRALFHYDPLMHRLEKIADINDGCRLLLDQANDAMGRQGKPDVLLVIAARFQRVSWKYPSIAYSVILKDVGCLYQTMCLVAGAMGLGACALGSGDSDLFSKIASLDYYTETSVGELAMGRRASG